MPPLEAAVSRRIAGPCEEHRAPARRCDILDALNYFVAVAKRNMS